MKNYIKNKSALITGATSGIGRQLAKDLTKMNVNLILTGRNKKRLKKLRKKLSAKEKNKIYIYLFDIRDKKETEKNMQKILKKHNIDILINNAGLALGIEPIDKGNIENWDTMIDTNIKGLLYVSKDVISQMRARNKGHIINLGSVAGKMVYPGGNIYCATKSAIHSITESMNADLLSTNIKVGVIAPGAVNTNFSNTRFGGDRQKADSTYKGYTPLYAKDISNAIINMLNTKKSVNIQYMDIMPTAQRNPYLLAKSESN